MSNNKFIIKPKSLKGEDEYRTFSVRLRKDLFLKIENICSICGYNRNEIIKMSIEYALSNMVIEEKKHNV